MILRYDCELVEEPCSSRVEATKSLAREGDERDVRVTFLVGAAVVNFKLLSLVSGCSCRERRIQSTATNVRGGCRVRDDEVDFKYTVIDEVFRVDSLHVDLMVVAGLGQHLHACTLCISVYCCF